MLHALAPKRSRGFGRVWLSLALGALWPLVVAAQDTKKGATAPSPKDASKAGAKAPSKGEGKDAEKGAPADQGPSEQAQAGVVDVANVKKAEAVELFTDERDEALLPFDKFPQLPAVRGAPPVEEMKKMATGAIPVNRDAIQKFVDAEAASLTSHTYLKALVDPESVSANPTNSVFREFSRASTALLEPLYIPAQAAVPQFKQLYNRALLATLPKLLSHQLHVRSVAMLVLAKSGEPDCLPIFVKSLIDADQVFAVNDWAAQGITNLAQEGRRDLESGKANAAAKALSDFLQREEGAPWPIQMHALQALGALRLATDTQGQGNGEMANVALKFLSDKNANPAVRAYAAKALGMMKWQQVAGFNYSLVAYHIGKATLDMGEKIASLYYEKEEAVEVAPKKTTKKSVPTKKNSWVEANSVQASRLTGYIMFGIVPGLLGEDGVRDSGITKAPNLGNTRKQVDEISKRVQAVAVAAYNLTSPTAAKSEKPKAKKELDSALAALKDALAKNPPSGRKLVPDGPDFPGPGAEVAGATPAAK